MIKPTQDSEEPARSVRTDAGRGWPLALFTMSLVGAGYASIAATITSTTVREAVLGSTLGVSSFLTMRAIGSSVASTRGAIPLARASGLGCLLLGAAAILWLATFGRTASFIALGLVGAACGWLDVFLNAQVLARMDDTALRRLQAMFPMGALTSAGIASLAYWLDLPIQLVPLTLAGAALLTGVAWLSIAGQHRLAHRQARPVWHHRWAVGIVAIALYIGGEVAMANVLPAQADTRVGLRDAVLSTMALAMFWLGFTIARLIRWPDRLDVGRVIGLGLVPAIVSTMIFQPALRALVFLALGFFAGPMLPALFRTFTVRGEEQLSSAVLIIAATLGGAGISLLITYVMDRGGLAIGTLAIVAAAVPACVLLASPRRLRSRLIGESRE